MGVDTARWRETDLTRTVLEWWYEDLHGRQPKISLAVLTRALRCAMRRLRRCAGRDCCDWLGRQLCW